jgi:tRNA(Ile)-lysidine synthetase-like protein
LGVMADFELIESLRVEPGKSVSVGREVWVQSDDCGEVKKVLSQDRGFKAGISQIKLGNRVSKAEFSGVRFSWKFAMGGKFQIPRGVLGAETFDAEKVGETISLRHWQAGDRFQPIGMKSAVSLQDWFTNQKIPAARRRELIVATTERGEVFWVEGLRIGERFKLGKQTRRRLIWRWIRQ